LSGINYAGTIAGTGVFHTRILPSKINDLITQM